MATKKAEVLQPRMKRAQLVADVVNVLCPHCSEPQPNPDDGGDEWTRDNFRTFESKRNGRVIFSHVRGCMSCEGVMLIDADPKVRFE